MSWLNATNTENGLNAEHWLKWAEIQSEIIDESLIDLACDQGNFTETQVQEVQNFDKNLKLLILSWMGSDAFLHIRNAVYGTRRMETGQPAVFVKDCKGRSAISLFVFSRFLSKSHTKISKHKSTESMS